MPPAELSSISRRSLLKTGLVGAALVGVGSAALLLQAPKPYAQAGALKVLHSKEAGVLGALAERVCPSLGPGAPGAAGVGLVEQIDEALRGADEDVQQGFKMALTIFDNAFTGALFGERVRPFTQLDGPAQDRVIQAWQQSGVGFRRTVMRVLVSTINSLYWGDERTWARIGYDGPPDLAGMRAAYRDNLVDLNALRATSVAKGS